MCGTIHKTLRKKDVYKRQRLTNPVQLQTHGFVYIRLQSKNEQTLRKISRQFYRMVLMFGKNVRTYAVRMLFVVITTFSDTVILLKPNVSLVLRCGILSSKTDPECTISSVLFARIIFPCTKIHSVSDFTTENTTRRTVSYTHLLKQ